MLLLYFTAHHIVLLLLQVKMKKKRQPSHGADYELVEPVGVPHDQSGQAGYTADGFLLGCSWRSSLR